MLEKTVEGKIRTVYFVSVATLMYYLLQEVLQLPVYFTFRHVLALVLIASAFVCFLIRPNIARASTAVKAGMVLSAQMLVMLTASLLIWCVERTETVLIFRGLSYYFFFINQISAAFAAMAMLYVFGERGLWYNLLAILTANVMMIVTIMAEYGVGTYFRELWTLIRTFSDETGAVIIHAEIHELAFCVGGYLVYLLLYPRRSAWYLLFLGVSGFCFLSAFKRIAMAAIAAALAMGWLLRLLEKRGRHKLAFKIMTAVMAAAIVVLLAYVAVVKLGVFTWLEEAGINTSGRAETYEAVDGMYTFSPAFLGRGMGYLTYQIGQDTTLNMDTVHNDFLQLYIDVGFWGYILWLAAFTLLRIRYFGRRGNTAAAINAFAVLMYMLLTSSTDNTMNYPLVHTTIAILIAGHGFNQRVQEEETRLFGYVSPENRLKGDGG